MIKGHSEVETLEKTTTIVYQKYFYVGQYYSYKTHVPVVEILCFILSGKIGYKMYVGKG